MSVENLNSRDESYESMEDSEQNKRQRDMHLNPEEGVVIAEKLNVLLDKYKDKRVLVIGPPCSGKSTLLQHIENGIDMDTVFDTMPEDFKRHVLHHENPIMFLSGDKKIIKYTEKKFTPGDTENEGSLKLTSQELNDYMNNNLKIVPGQPVFGTNLIDADVIVYLKLSDEGLDKRIDSRNTKTHRRLQRDRVLAIRKLIESEVEELKQKGLIVEEFEIN